MLLAISLLASALTGGTPGASWVPGSTQRVGQLTGDIDPQGRPLLNRTGRWGIEGTDMGCPVEHRGRLVLFLGDVPSARDADPIVFTTDHTLRPGGFRLHPVLRGGRFRPFHAKGLTERGFLGTNETPTGAFSHGGRVYVFTVTGGPRPVSHLTSSDDLAKEFDLHGQVSDTSGRFWQIAPWIVKRGQWAGVPAREGVLLWGQRIDAVHLAWLPLRKAIPSLVDLRYFAGPSRAWSTRQEDAVPIVATGGITQLSVTWLPGPRRWIMLYTKASPRSPLGGIVARVGKTPWDWSEEVTLFDPRREGAFGRYMHEPGKDSLHRLPPTRPEDHFGWAYAPYLLARYTRWDARSRVATLTYLMSTNSPYQVMLMRSGLRIGE